jgi:hypothetical protein
MKTVRPEIRLAAQALVAIRNRKLSHERKREIASIAGKASGVSRRKNSLIKKIDKGTNES